MRAPEMPDIAMRTVSIIGAEERTAVPPLEANPQPGAQECFHCGLPVPQGSTYAVAIGGQTRPMCCPGCKAVAQAIVDGGLEDYYRHRTERPRNPVEQVPAVLRELEIYDRPALQQTFVRVADEHVREAALILEGIVCAACVWLNERHVSALPGVLEFRVNYATHRAQLKWDARRIQLSEILQAIAAIGYVAHPFDAGRQEVVQKRERSMALKRIAVAGLGTMQVMMIAVALYTGEYQGMDSDLHTFLRWVSLVITTPVVLYSARPFFQGAWRDLRRRRLGMDVPVALAIGAAFLASLVDTILGRGAVYYDSVTMFTFFLLSGRYLEMAARHRAGMATEALVRLLPAAATRIDPHDGAEQVVAVAELRPGDRVLVHPGETVPADGRVHEGTSSVDESLLTGEGVPRPRQCGDALIGGTVNVQSPLIMEVRQVGPDTVLSAIVRLLDRAQSEKPRIALLADRAAVWFVAALLAIAAVVGAWWWQHDPANAFRVVLAVLVVTCPCALSLATPAAVTAATGALTRLGLLTTRGHALETLARTTHVILDKTGTLTYGRLGLVEVQPLADWSADECLAIGAALERGSEHPVARVLARHGNDAVVAHELVATAGRGVAGVIDGRRFRIGTFTYVAPCNDTPAPSAPELSEVLLGDEQGLIARFRFADAPRRDAPEAVKGLAALGLHLQLLSGDSPGVVARAAEALGIPRAEGGLRPEGKLARMRALQEQGAVVAAVGDGVNDAPVLAGAQVSLAMGGGTQLAHASADMILLSESLPVLTEGVRVARRTLRVIRQNLAWAVTYNALAVPLAAAGWVAPWMAAIGMSASSLIVVLNALRLARGPGRRRGAVIADHGAQASHPVSI